MSSFHAKRLLCRPASQSLIKKKWFTHIILEKSGLIPNRYRKLIYQKFFFRGLEQATRACQIFSNKILEMMIKPNN